MNMNRIRRPISDAELKRRWALVRKMLKEKEIGALFLQNSNMHLGGYARWFTDIPAEYNLPMTVLFPGDEEMTLVRSVDAPLAPYPPLWAARGVKEILNAPFSPTLNYTADIEAGLVSGYFRKRNYKRIGFVNKAMIAAGFMVRLQAALPGVEFVDVTEEIDLFKALKSDEEMERIREICKIQDAAWAALPAVVKPGMKEFQIRSELMELLMNLGSEEHLMFIGTAGPGKPCGMAMFNFANRTVQPGDYGTLLIEVSGPGGYYAESARNFCFGEPYQAMVDMWEVAVKGQQLTADLLVPGQDTKVIVREYNKFIRKQGYCEEGRLFGHSQGYDLIERPAFMPDDEWGGESMPILAGMNCSLHPFITNEQCTVYVNDNFHITDKYTEKLHKTPPEIIIL